MGNKSANGINSARSPLRNGRPERSSGAEVDRRWSISFIPNSSAIERMIADLPIPGDEVRNGTLPAFRARIIKLRA